MTKVGLIASETSATGVTVSVVLPVTPLVSVAMMVVVPPVTAVARPLLIVATDVEVDDHATVLVRGWSEPSVK